MYGQAADARPQPSPPASRHGHGRPPEGRTSRSWGFNHAISSLFGWSQVETPALPTLMSSGPHAHSHDVHSDGAVQHQSGVALSYSKDVPSPMSTTCIACGMRPRHAPAAEVVDHPTDRPTDRPIRPNARASPRAEFSGARRAAAAAAAAMPVRTPVLGASFHAVAATLLCMATTHSLAVAL